VAAVTPTGAGYACLACGAPRELHPGTTVIESDPVVLPRKSRPPAVLGNAITTPSAPAPARPLRVARPSRGKAGVLRAAGILLLAAGIAGAAVSVALTGGAAGFLLAAAAGGAGVGMGGLLLRAGGQASARAHRSHGLATEQAVLSLAAELHGVLRVTDVARGLGITVAEADEALSNLADGSRVTAEITTEGLLVYHFREIESAPRMRVDVDGASDEEEDEQPVEVEDAAPERERLI